MKMTQSLKELRGDRDLQCIKVFFFVVSRGLCHKEQRVFISGQEKLHRGIAI